MGEKKKRGLTNVQERERSGGVMATIQEAKGKIKSKKEKAVKVSFADNSIKMFMIDGVSVATLVC